MIWEQTASAVSAAPPAVVWDALVDGRRWSFWNPAVEWMWIEGEPAPGALATIKFHGVRQTALVIEAFAPHQIFALRLSVGPVARLAVTWILHVDGSGTRIESRVQIAGIAAGFLLKRPGLRIAAAMPASLERLAAYALQPRER